ncbi:MAG: VWA domain-containing protein [Bacteroidota bacterium]
MKTLINGFLVFANLCGLLICCHQIQPTEHSSPATEADYFDSDGTLPSTVSTTVPAEQLAHFSTASPFAATLQHPLSTFSIDVDRGSYSHIRRFLMEGHLPPPAAVRIEEMINYFHYDYPPARGEVPFSITMEAGTCPWNSAHQLVHIGLQGRQIIKDNLPANNLVFLLDVSGSMDQPHKLPLLKNAFKLLVQELRPQDRVAIIVYAGASGLVLPSTSGVKKRSILLALEQLKSGGSTAGAAGLQLAYKVAKLNFIKGGNNRIILATDGDFNVGLRSEEALVHLIEQKRTQGIALSVLGFGKTPYEDHKMEQLADHGNGNYAYIDNIKEAQKVLVQELSSTLHTIAKDVKLQVEFNPSQIKAYRLIGYENRLLQDEDFYDDQKDAGELGAGHSVTALYEVVPTDGEATRGHLHPPLQPQSHTVEGSHATAMMSVKLRYKKPAGQQSQQIEQILDRKAIQQEQPSANFRFSAAVVGFGLLLRQSAFKGEANYPMIMELARSARGKDELGYRSEFLHLVELAAAYTKEEWASDDPVK